MHSLAAAESSPGQVIRTLRRGLNMSQAEFAHAAGWAPSTISRWERGAAQPSRLALKIILAFAEERGVRYRPKPIARALVPLYEGRAGWAAAVGRERLSLQPREPDRSDCGAPAPERIDRPTPRPPGVRPARLEGERFVSVNAGSRGWNAEASIRLSVGSAERRSAGSWRAALGWVGVATAAVWAVVAIGMPGSARQPSSVERSSRNISALAAAWPGVAELEGSSSGPWQDRFAPRRAAQQGASSSATDDVPQGLAAASVAIGKQADRPLAGETPAPVVAAAPAPAPESAPLPVARLDSVVVIGGEPRATFRTEDGPVTVMEGETLGRQQVGAIATDRVTLVSPAGESHTIRLGYHTPLE